MDKKPQTDDSGFLLAPIQLPASSSGKDAWCYEDGQGLDVHLEHPQTPHASVRIPWRVVLAAAARHAKRKEPK